jgi:hypothetical protein
MRTWSAIFTMDSQQLKQRLVNAEE